MGYGDELCRLLRPLGVYDLNPGSFSEAELRSVGAALDEIDELLTLNQREASPLTASEAGLAVWERLLGILPAGDPDARRALCAALMQAGDLSFTPAAIRALLACLGVSALLTEAGNQTVRVSFPGLRGIPAQIDAIQAAMDRVMPCHLNLIYDYRWLIWDEFETLTWSRAETFTWDELAVWDPEV